MSCNNTTHAESAKTKTFCPECGEKLTPDDITRLNTFIVGNPQFTFPDLYKFMINEELKLKEDIVYHSNKFQKASDFITENPFMTLGSNDFILEVKHIYRPNEYHSKKKIYDMGLPTGIHEASKKFLTTFMDSTFGRFHPDDENKVIACISNYISKKNSKIDTNSYLLQDCDIQNNRLIHYHNSYRSAKDISEIKIMFGRFLGNIIRYFMEDGQACIFRPGETRYWKADRMHIDDVSEIREWFETRPSSWIRNKEFEEEYLKKY